MKRVVVTGAQGFIGRHILPLLAKRDFEVHAIEIDEWPTAPDNVQCHKADLLSANDIHTIMQQVQPTHLVHLAWFTKHGEFWNSPQNIRWCQSGLDLLQAFTACGGKRFVGAGTCAEYEWSSGICREYHTPEIPKSLYGVYKHSLYKSAMALADRTGVSAAWGRIFHLYGPYEFQERLVPYVIRSLLSGKMALCSEGTVVRDFMYVEDVAAAFVEVLDSTIEGPVNIASGIPVTLRDIIVKTGTLLNRPDLIGLGARPTPADEPPSIVADPSRLNHEVGFWPHWTLEMGLTKTIDWWKNNAHSTGKVKCIIL